MGLDSIERCPRPSRGTTLCQAPFLIENAPSQTCPRTALSLSSGGAARDPGLDTVLPSYSAPSATHGSQLVSATWRALMSTRASMAGCPCQRVPNRTGGVPVRGCVPLGAPTTVQSSGAGGQGDARVRGQVGYGVTCGVPANSVILAVVGAGSGVASRSRRLAKARDEHVARSPCVGRHAAHLPAQCPHDGSRACCARSRDRLRVGRLPVVADQQVHQLAAADVAAAVGEGAAGHPPGVDERSAS